MSEFKRIWVNLSCPVVLGIYYDLLKTLSSKPAIPMKIEKLENKILLFQDILPSF